MKALTLMMTLALLTSATAFADDGGEYPRTRDERNSCDGYPETCEEKGPTILFNQKWENPNETESKEENVRGGEGPGFVPYKHCVTGELVSLYKWQQDCGVPVHSECRQILTKNGYQTSCQ